VSHYVTTVRSIVVLTVRNCVCFPSWCFFSFAFHIELYGTAVKICRLLHIRYLFKLAQGEIRVWRLKLLSRMTPRVTCHPRSKTKLWFRRKFTWVSIVKRLALCVWPVSRWCFLITKLTVVCCACMSDRSVLTSPMFCLFAVDWVRRL